MPLKCLNHGKKYIQIIFFQKRYTCVNCAVLKITMPKRQNPYLATTLMFPPLSDTNPEIKEIQISLIRKAGAAGRTMRMRSLSQTVVKLSRRAIMRTHPGCDQREVDLIFVSLHYGNDIANRLENYLGRKRA